MAKSKGKAAQEFEEDAQRSGPGQVDADSDAEAEAEGTKSKYETMVIGISKTRKATHNAIVDLATKLGCKPSDLMWEGAARVLKDPPKTAPVGATTNVGSAAGFWVVPQVNNNNGKATGVKVVEVESRGQVTNGRTFFRFTKDDEKGRNRAMAQAIKAAQYDLNLLGIKQEVKAEKFKA